MQNLVKRVRRMTTKAKMRPDTVSDPVVLYSLPLITCAASLANYGLFGLVKEMWLSDVDLTSVPDKHLASLVSTVTGILDISKISGCDLVTILDSINCKCLYINSQRLDIEETWALVRAMKTRVKKVRLYEGVTLDISALVRYNGLGSCREVECISGLLTVVRYKEELKTWAASRNWKVGYDDQYFFIIHNYLNINNYMYI